jgi:hypothetical protein
MSFRVYPYIRRFCRCCNGSSRPSEALTEKSKHRIAEKIAYQGGAGSDPGLPRTPACLLCFPLTLCFSRTPGPFVSSAGMNSTPASSSAVWIFPQRPSGTPMSPECAFMSGLAMFLLSVRVQGQEKAGRPRLSPAISRRSGQPKIDKMVLTLGEPKRSGRTSICASLLSMSQAAGQRLRSLIRPCSSLTNWQDFAVSLVHQARTRPFLHCVTGRCF